MGSPILPFDIWPLAFASGLCMLSIFVALDVAERVRSVDVQSANAWWVGGAIAVGCGLWGSHFLGLHARSLPQPVGYAMGPTMVAWTCAVGSVALMLATVRRSTARTAGTAATLGIALLLSVMLLAGQAASDWAPGPTWKVSRAAIALVLTVAYAALLMAGLRWVARASGWSGRARQALVALGLGLAGPLLETYALSAATMPPGAICLTAAELDGSTIASMTLVGATLVLGCTLCGSIVYGWVDRRREQLAGSLESAEARLVSVNDELRQHAFLDSLTGLPNRLLLEDRLSHALQRIERAKRRVRGNDEKLALLFIDIDGFMPINQSLGHVGGDELLRQFADRVVEEARTSDTVARVGADQFLVLMEGLTTTGDCLALASRVIAAAKAPFTVSGRQIPISVSIGIVIHPDQGERDKLIANADTAMRAAKRAGRGTYALFEPHMQKETADQLDLINDLRQAVELGQLQLHYQPKIDGKRRVICGVEALLRWHHPARGFVSPAVFIPIAERFGFINTLGNWVIDEACRQIESWAASGVHMRVAINLSVHQLREVELVARIEGALGRHGVHSSQLLCEITESVAMQDFAATERTLDALGRIGVYLSIDDFGTGYSSLSYLRQLPARQLKIDRSFIHDLEASGDARAVVDAVVRLAHALGLRVVAEGVETSAQRDILLKLGCDELQGYFFAQPMPADKLLEWTTGKRPEGAVDFAQSLWQPALAA